MVKQPRALVLLALLLGVVVWLLFFRGGDTPAVSPAAPSAPGEKGDVAWINVDRLKAENPLVSLGNRNIFQYKLTPPPTPPPTPEPDMPVEAGPTTPIAPPTPPPPPPIELRFMGVVKVQDGSRVAVLQTPQKEILHGRQGDILAGRYKIVDIKLESVEIQEIASGHKQTLRIGGR